MYLIFADSFAQFHPPVKWTGIVPNLPCSKVKQLSWHCTAAGAGAFVWTHLPQESFQNLKEQVPTQLQKAIIHMNEKKTSLLSLEEQASHLQNYSQ